MSKIEQSNNEAMEAFNGEVLTGKGAASLTIFPIFYFMGNELKQYMNKNQIKKLEKEISILKGQSNNPLYQQEEDATPKDATLFIPANTPIGDLPNILNDLIGPKDQLTTITLSEKINNKQKKLNHIHIAPVGVSLAISMSIFATLIMQNHSFINYSMACYGRFFTNVLDCICKNTKKATSKLIPKNDKGALKP